jgi:ubiquinone/menaquinone biosynthesis C-methylase UbiE
MTHRIVEEKELVDGMDAVLYNTACDYPETSDYGILAEKLASEIGLQGKNVLEIGSGPGNLCKEILDRGASIVIGVDGASSMVNHALEKYQEDVKENKLDFRKESVYDLRFNPRFDLVVCQNSFHQLHHPAEALNEMVKVCADGGTVYVADFRRDVSREEVMQRLHWTKPEIRQIVIESINAALTKQEFRDILVSIEGITSSVTNAVDPHGISGRVNELIRRDPVPHFRDYVISQTVRIHKNEYIDPAMQRNEMQQRLY